MKRRGHDKALVAVVPKMLQYRGLKPELYKKQQCVQSCGSFRPKNVRLLMEIAKPTATAKGFSEVP